MSDTKYRILRRAIQYGKTVIPGGVSIKQYTTVELKVLCASLEGKDEGQLKDIHKEWIGY